METFAESLSSDGQIVPIKKINFEEQIIPYNPSSAELVETNKILSRIPDVRNFASNLTQKVKSFTSALKSNQQLQPSAKTLTTEESFDNVLQLSKQNAQLNIQQILLAAQEFNQTIQHSLTSVPAHPYDRLVYQYLGPDFVCPTIYELETPQNYCPIQATKEIIDIKNKLSDLQTTQISIMSAEALDTNFYGITSQNLNNAFAFLSTTCSGDQFIINDRKLSEHLSFVETIKSIPIDYIQQNPMEVAQKLINRFIQIQKM